MPLRCSSSGSSGSSSSSSASSSTSVSSNSRSSGSSSRDGGWALGLLASVVNEIGAVFTSSNSVCKALYDTNTSYYRSHTTTIGQAGNVLGSSIACSVTSCACVAGPVLMLRSVSSGLRAGVVLRLKWVDVLDAAAS